MKKLTLSLIAALAVVSTPILAGNDVSQKTPDRKINPFSECGIGALLMPKSAPGAISTNIAWDLGTTAISSASVSKGLCAGHKAKAARFVNKRYEVLEEETAKGSGENLTSLLNMLKCDSKKHDDAIEQARTELAKSVSEESYESMSHREKSEAFYFNMTKAVDGVCKT